MPSCCVAPLRVSEYRDEGWPCDVAGHAVSRRAREPGTGCHRGSQQSRTFLFIPVSKAIRHAITQHRFKGHVSQDFYRTHSSRLLPLLIWLWFWLWVGGVTKIPHRKGRILRLKGGVAPSAHAGRHPERLCRQIYERQNRPDTHG